MVKLSRRRAQNSVIADREFSESEFIPYYCHWDGSTIVTKNDELMQVIKLDGFSFETADDEDVDMSKNLRNTLFKSISAGNYAIWVHTIRRRQVVHLEGDQPPGFASVLDKEWRKKHESREAYVNEIYISVVLKSDTKGIAAFEHFIKQLQHKADRSAFEAQIKENFKDISDLTRRIMATLREYNPKMLGVVETEGGNYSELMEFLSMLVNVGKPSRMLVPTINISSYLPTERLYFGPRAIEARGVSGKSRFAGMVSVKEYPPHTSAGMIDAFLQLPMEFIISQSFSFANRQASIGDMKIQQRRMSSSGDVAISQTAEITHALDMAMSGSIAFGTHQFSIMCIEDELKHLENSLSTIYGEMVNVGINPVRETYNMQAAYWAQLPANFEYRTRSSTIHTLNLASFASMHNYPSGRRRGNHWGPALTVFDTTSGTPYFFNFHSRDVGHTTIIGPTGAGKTVLMNFLCAQAQKYKGRMFFFDKDRGADIFLRAVGGSYTIIEPGKNCGFNPLQLEDTPENRSFLVDWFMALISARGEEKISPEDVETINEAIEGNYKLPKEQRMLRNVAPFFGIQGPGTIANKLKMWHSGESHSRLFDNAEDTIDFTRNNIFGFEMGHVLADKVSIGPVLLYLFQRIQHSLDGTPTIIVLDEAWALIDSPVFAPRIKDWLKTLRKLNAMVVFATQSVEDASKSNISDTLIQQTATQIFLPNLKATEEYKKTFMLSDREFTLIKTTNPASRFFLVKQGTEVVVARIDLSGMDNIIHVLSARAETVRLLDEIREEVGDDPNKWLPVFYERVHEVT